MLMVELSVTPLDKGDSVADFVAQAVEIIDRSGLRYEVGPMGTIIEGEFREVMDLVEECVETLSEDSQRFLFEVRGDLRRTNVARLDENVEAIEDILAHELPQ